MKNGEENEKRKMRKEENIAVNTKKKKMKKDAKESEEKRKKTKNIAKKKLSRWNASDERWRSFAKSNASEKLQNRRGCVARRSCADSRK